MTADVPDPRFRDQLVEAIEEALREGNPLYYEDAAPELADALLPLIAAEVEARVQAAANQRAAEERATHVWIDPARRSGEPCVGGHRLGVETIVDSVWSSSVDNAMDLYCIDRGRVLVACWYAGVGYPVRLHANDSSYRPYRGPWRKRWGAWAAEVHQALWQSTTVDYDAIPDPPRAAALAQPATGTKP